jgi:small subunit ribosomal protein S21
MNGIGIKVGKNENFLKALGRFRRMVRESGILDLYKSKQEFTKPSVERRIERKRRKANSKRYSRRVKY